ncbi:uncharacterized protein LOC125207044 [Salvia hispanica]|uniref:uncharacterized protein LOC125207044 n=1 Tax=Salvia hispanica TaxID=49212 RepID=UPI002009987C|nr:uncharacterized protein LOC125207044 [Salvia hispanica]
MSYESDHFNEFDLPYGDTKGQVRISQPVKGLICIYCNLKLNAPLAICNPFLGRLEILPLATPSCEIGGVSWREVAIGFDEDHEDYKVVQLYSCNAYSCIHAKMYRKRTNAWEQLADGVFNDLRIYHVSPIVSRCKNSHFAYWSAHYVGVYDVRIILSFDMKNEVFRKITLPEPDPNPVAFSQVFVEDEHSFLNIVLTNVISPLVGGTSTVEIYESRFEGSELSWNYVKNVEVTSFTRVPLLMASCVFIPDGLWGNFVYDYRARNIIARQSINYVLVEYRASLVLP